MLHVASPDADTQGLPFFVPCTPPTIFFLYACVFFFWYQGDLVTRFSTDAFIILKWFSYFQSSPISIFFFAFAFTTINIVGVRCLRRRANGRQKGHESKNLGSHLLGTHLLGHPKQNGEWRPNMKCHHGLCLIYAMNALSISYWGLESHSMEWPQLERANKIKILWTPRPVTEAFYGSGFSAEVEKEESFNGKRTFLQAKGWQKEEDSPSLQAMNVQPIHPKLSLTSREAQQSSKTQLLIIPTVLQSWSALKR